MGRHASDLPASLAVQLDRLADRFEAAWRSGERPQIEDFLADANAPRRDALAELLLLEWELRDAAGERPDVGEYQDRFPAQREFVAGVLTAAQHSAAADDTPGGSQATWTEGGALRELPGEFGDYTLLEVLGRGGMGVVYMARQRSLDRLVAVKLLRSGAASDEADIERFRREAEAAARLDHPQIVSIYEVGRHADEPFFSMEYVAGRSLASLVAEHPLEPQRAARYLRDVAAAIHYSHEQGILHRDLKPSNVLIDRFDRPRVMDFGLARRIETDTRLTATGALLGTPSYMPPEQAAGGAAPLGAPADVYAMGAMLYELVTGRPPFQAATALDTLMMVVDRAPIPPRSLNAKVPRDLETICLKCLEKSPSRRYATAAQLAGDLDRFVRGLPITARRVGRLQRAGRWCRRNPALASLSGLAAAALVATASSLVALAISQSLASRRLAQENQATQAALATATARGRALEISAERLRDETARTKRALDEFRKSQSGAAIIAINHSARLCEQGDHAGGLLWLARGLQLVPEDDVQQQWSVRTRISIWRRSLDAFTANLNWEINTRRATHLRPIVGPHGKTMLTGGNVQDSNRGEARLWDMASGEPLTPLLYHGELLDSMALSPDGETVLTAGGGVARLWDAATGKPRNGPLQAPTSSIRGATFSPDGSWIALVDATTHVQRYETATGRSLGSYTTSTANASRSLVCICPDRRTFLVQRSRRTDDGSGLARYHTTVQRRDLATGDVVGPAIEIDGYLGGCLISPDCSRLMLTRTVLNQNTTRLWDTETGQPLGATLDTEERIHHAVFSPAGDTLLTYSGVGITKGDLRLWDTRTAEALSPPLKDVEGLLAVGFLPQHVWLLTYSGGRLWDVEKAETAAAPVPDEAELFFPTWIAPQQNSPGEPCSRAWVAGMLRHLGSPLQHPVEAVWAARFNADGTRLATATNRSVRQWDPATGEQVAAPADISWGSFLGYREDGRTLVTTSEFKDLLWEATRSITTSQIHPLAFTDNYSHIAGAASTGKPEPLLLVETATRRAIELPTNGEATVFSWAVFNPAGSRIVAAPNGLPPVWMWDINGRPIWNDPTLRAARAVFSPDGKLLATSYGPAVQLLNAKTGQPDGDPLSHPNYVYHMAFSPDGKLLATGYSGAVQLWEVATRQRLGPFMTHTYVVNRLREIVFSPDGKTLVLCCVDPTARHWPAPGPVAGQPEDVLLATEVLTGLELPLDGQPRVLSAAEWHERRQSLRDADAPAR